MVERPAVLTILHDPVIRARRNQKRHNTDHRKERNSVQTLQRARKFLIAIAKNRSELETEQDLRTENQYPRLVQSKLDLFCELHVANAGSTERR
jgi:hypothetical protein